jgi:hypothetical protein
MADRAMLESSMLLHRDSANYLLALARTGPLGVVVSERVLEMMADSESDGVVRRLAAQLDIPPNAVDFTVVRQLARELREVVETYRLPPESERFTWHDGDARLFQRALMDSTQDEVVAQIIFDEWYFLTFESWLFSKTRRAFDKMVEAGATAIHVSGRQFDRVVRGTLKKGPDEPLTPGNRVRAAAKWIAASGPPILSLFEPISGAGLSAAGSSFLLMDP